MKRAVTVDFDDMFDDLSYYEQISFLADKICDQRLEDKLKILRTALADVEIMDFIRQHTDVALKVLRGDGYVIH